jgi:RNA polymerase sigma-70 factor (ECF subfamily)
MGATPTTCPSLLLRIRDRSDQEAWRQFVALYGPLVYQYARRKGLQDADAADVAQVVFQAISEEIARLEYDPRRGSFRGWVLAVTRNQVNKHLERSRVRGRTAPGRFDQQALDRCTAANRDAELWEQEYRQRAFRLVAERVQHEFEGSSWQAFWRTAVEGQAASDVGERLGMSVGAVYTARSRVLTRLKAAVAEYDEEDEDLFAGQA